MHIKKEKPVYLNSNQPISAKRVVYKSSRDKTLSDADQLFMKAYTETTLENKRLIDLLAKT